ncbi:MAG: lytic transglycosylase domain-containing protein [Saprospiraceae bacterium]|nr:lytic transglycosylase domain-containing protein [Saprospiraceae bacterium]
MARLKFKWSYIFFLFIGIMGTVMFTATKTDETGSWHIYNRVIKSPDLKSKTFNFAGEKLPMDNEDVRERLDRELIVNTYAHSVTVLNLKRSNKYFPIIDKILLENGLPADFKYLAVAESNLFNATSPAGAKGFWQFMKGTATDYGLEVNNEVDERLDLEKSTIAACRFLKDTYSRFGSWSLVAAAYNMGGGRLTSEMSTQRAANFYELNLNQETSRYFFRLVAIKEIMEKPQDYGFFLENADLYDPIGAMKEIVVDYPVPNWGDFAIANGSNYRELKIYNPWLLESFLTNKDRKQYIIKLPVKN